MAPTTIAATRSHLNLGATPPFVDHHTRPMRWLLVPLLLTLTACPTLRNVECLESSNCDLAAGGVCSVNAPTGNQWCSYPDPACPSGMRWSDFDVGDGIAGVCVDATSPDDGGVNPDDAIAFVSTRDGNQEIYRMRPDGSLQTNLTSNPADDFSPLWDPTGMRIAFLSNRGGTQQLYTMSPDGSNVVNVSAGQAESPAWSSDGLHLAFTSNRSGSPEIFKVSPDGSLLVPLTSLANAATGTPSWAPDGTRIAFASSGRIHVMNADGTNIVAISPGAPRGERNPAWSPTGSRIAFARGLTFEDHDIFVMSPDGSGLTNVTENAPSATADTFETSASWSPDGAHLAGDIFQGLTQQPTFGTGLYVVEVSGAGFDNIVLPPAFHPCWSPDGSSLGYDSSRTGNAEIYVIARGGGTSGNLTNSAGDDTQCSWRPR